MSGEGGGGLITDGVGEFCVVAQGVKAYERGLFVCDAKAGSKRMSMDVARDVSKRTCRLSKPSEGMVHLKHDQSVNEVGIQASNGTHQTASQYHRHSEVPHEAMRGKYLGSQMPVR